MDKGVMETSLHVRLINELISESSNNRTDRREHRSWHNVVTGLQNNMPLPLTASNVIVVHARAHLYVSELHQATVFLVRT